MIRLCGVCCGLVVFSGVILRGIVAGNTAQQIVVRAVAGMFAAFILGSVTGWVGMLLVRDNLTAPDDAASPTATNARTPTVS